jgi:kynureninase
MLADLPFEPSEDFARRLDAEDPLRPFRDQFVHPRRPDGRAVVYLCGHSLGLQPAGARALVEQELDDWARLGVEAHFRGTTPWYSYHETLRAAGARLVGGLPHEVIFMNSLTVNLHLLMATFYRPVGRRRCILTDEPPFPSDLYAMQSQIRWHGLDPTECLLTVRPRDGEHCIRLEDVERFLDQRGAEIALVLWNPVNYLTGQLFDVPRLTGAAHRAGCIVGLDLAHSAGNVVLRLHDWRVDFAAWCGYKYLNGGPGAAAGCFVHADHGDNPSLPRLAGWWGNDPATRFRMHLERDFTPKAGADGWQVSNPPVLAMAPLRASLTLFNAAGMEELRAKSERLTAYCEYLLDQRGCQLSLLVHDRPLALVEALETECVVCDFREPNVVRAAPVPLYNGFHDVWLFADVLRRFFG